MKKKVIQIAHVTSIPGPVQTLAEFIENEKYDLKKIYFRLNNKSSLFYIKDFLLVLKKIFKEKDIDIGIGMNCFDTLPLLLLKKFKNIKQIVFFNTDFSRNRFGNQLLNFMYISIDKYCAKKADFICCNSQRTIKERIKEGIDLKKIIYTPNGVFLKKIKKLDKGKYNKKLVFIGHITKEHGLIDILKRMQKNNLFLEVIGSGLDLDFYKSYINNNNLESRVKFLGQKNHDEVLSYLSDFNGFGLAPYSDSFSDWTYYCDPVKVKEYLACLVPVIISSVPEVSNYIKDNKIGFVYKDSFEFEKILKKINTMDNKIYKNMVKNLKKIRGEFDLEKIYSNMFNKFNKDEKN